MYIVDRECGALCFLFDSEDLKILREGSQYSLPDKQGTRAIHTHRLFLNPASGCFMGPGGTFHVRVGISTSSLNTGQAVGKILQLGRVVDEK